METKTFKEVLYESKMNKLAELQKAAQSALDDYKRLWETLDNLENELSDEDGILNDELNCGSLIYAEDEFTSCEFSDIDRELSTAINHICLIRKDLQKEHDMSKLHQDAYGYIRAKGNLYSCFTTYPSSEKFDLSIDEVNRFYEMCCNIANESKDDFIAAINKEYKQ